MSNGRVIYRPSLTWPDTPTEFESTRGGRMLVGKGKTKVDVQTVQWETEATYSMPYPLCVATRTEADSTYRELITEGRSCRESSR